MSETTVLAAFSTLLATSTFTGGATPLIRAVYTDIPDMPYQGAFPWAVVSPETQISERVSLGMVQQHGFYTILYFDEVGSGLTTAQIMQNARAFAATLRTQIRQDPSLGGVVDGAGEDRGIIVHYSDAGMVQDLADEAMFQIPISVHVRDKAEVTE